MVYLWNYIDFFVLSLIFHVFRGNVKFMGKILLNYNFFSMQFEEPEWILIFWWSEFKYYFLLHILSKAKSFNSFNAHVQQF